MHSLHTQGYPCRPYIQCTTVTNVSKHIIDECKKAPAYHASSIVLARRLGEISIGTGLTTIASTCQFADLTAGAEHAFEFCCGSIETTVSVGRLVLVVTLLLVGVAGGILPLLALN